MSSSLEKPTIGPKGVALTHGSPNAFQDEARHTDCGGEGCLRDEGDRCVEALKRRHASALGALDMREDNENVNSP